MGDNSLLIYLTPVIKSFNEAACFSGKFGEKRRMPGWGIDLLLPAVYLTYH